MISLSSYEIDFESLPNMTNDWIQRIWDNRQRYVVCKGGGGSGKSYGVIQLNVYRFIAEPGHKYLVVRKVAKTMRESIFALIQEIIISYDCMPLCKVNKTDMAIECINGNKFIFTGVDDVEKLKSIQGITDIIIEEASELEIEDYRQLNIRMRGYSKYPKQMFIMFNPIDVNHWLKKEFFDMRKTDATVIETTYKDNRFLDIQAIKVLEDFKTTDPYYYDVYCLGQWGVLGKTIFDSQKVNARIAAIQNIKPIKSGYFEYSYVNEKIVDSSIKWVSEVGGYIRIYEDVKAGYPYVIGGDTAGDGSDFFGNQVLDNTNGRQVAVLQQQQDEDLYTKQTYCLGRYYNTALIGLEVNFSTYPVKELQRLGYHKQYMREEEDSISGKLEMRFGFKTTKLTRPLIISSLVEIVREQTSLFNDIPTLHEMLTFVRDEKGKATAKQGAHDDLVMSIAIAYYVADQQVRQVAKIVNNDNDEDDDDEDDRQSGFFD